MTVYVIQEVAGRNVLSAEKYGKLELLLPEGSQLVLSTGPTVRRLNKKLKDFCDDDYLLLIGDPSMHVQLPRIIIVVDLNVLNGINVNLSIILLR